MRFLIHLPQTQGSDHASRTGNNDRRENRRNQQIHLGPAEHVSREAENLRWNIHRYPNGVPRLARARERRSGSDRRDKRCLRYERSNRHGQRQDRRPRGGGEEQRPPPVEALEHWIEGGEIDHLEETMSGDGFEMFCA